MFRLAAIVSRIRHAVAWRALDMDQRVELWKREQDELWPRLVEYLQRVEQVSVLALQEEFRIGFNRASSLIRTLSHAGLIRKDHKANKYVKIPHAVARRSGLTVTQVEAYDRKNLEHLDLSDNGGPVPKPKCDRDKVTISFLQSVLGINYAESQRLYAKLDEEALISDSDDPSVLTDEALLRATTLLAIAQPSLRVSQLQVIFSIGFLQASHLLQSLIDAGLINPPHSHPLSKTLRVKMPDTVKKIRM